MPFNCPKYTAKTGAGRGETRIACQIPCVIELEGRPSQRVELVSLSPSGARISHHFGLQPSDKLLITIGTERSAAATVVWVVGDIAGLKLRQKLELPCHLLSGHCLRAILASGETFDLTTITPEDCTALFKRNGLTTREPSADWGSADQLAES